MSTVASSQQLSLFPCAIRRRFPLGRHLATAKVKKRTENQKVKVIGFFWFLLLYELIFIIFIILILGLFSI